MKAMRNPAYFLIAASLVSPAVAAPIQYDCDAAGGAYSMISLVQPGPNYRVVGRLSARLFRANADWYPVANVSLVSGDQTGLVSVRIRRRSRADPIEFVLQSGSQRNPSEVVLLSAERNVATPFVIETVEGNVRVQVGDQTRTVNVPIVAGSMVRITCSSGHFVFEDLDWDALPSR